MSTSMFSEGKTDPGDDESSMSNNVDMDVKTGAGMDAIDDDDPYNQHFEWMSLCDEDEEEDDDAPLPLPGRESHTADMEVFSTMLEEMRRMEREPGENPFNETLWKYLEGYLQMAQPAGYLQLPNKSDCLPIGPENNSAIVGKYVGMLPVNPIHPSLVSEQTGVPLDEVITELLYAVEVNMMSMNWTPICGRCASPTCSTSDGRNRVGTTAYCRSCRYQTAVDCLEKIKVVFHFTQDVFYRLASSLPCKPSQAAFKVTELVAMVPATFTGSGFQISVGCDDEVRPPIPAGKYRLRCPITFTEAYLVIAKDATPDDEPHSLEFHVSDYIYKSGPIPEIHVPHGKIRFRVWTDSNSFFILWIQHPVDNKTLMYVPPEERPPLMAATTLMRHPTYRSIYEGTEDEGELFAKAVSTMTSDENASAKDAETR